MERSLHPKLAKRNFKKDENGKWVLDDGTAQQLVEVTREVKGWVSQFNLEEMGIKHEILSASSKVAVVRIDVPGDFWQDFLHIVKIDGEWKIVNVLWELNP